MRGLSPMKRLTTMVPQELMDGMDEVAEIASGNSSDVIRDAIAAHLFNGYWKPHGEVITVAILEHCTNEETLAQVLNADPAAPLTVWSVAWYRADMRKRLGSEAVWTDSETKRAFGLA